MSKLQELEKRLADEPDNLGLRVLLASALHEAGRRNESIELYRSVAIAYREQGRTQQAIAACHSVLAFAPEDAGVQELLALLGARQVRPSQQPPVERLTPPRLPRPPMPGPAAAEAEPEPEPEPEPDVEDEDEEMSRPSFGDVTPLPAPLPYHLADPVTAPVKVAPAGRLMGPANELMKHPQLAGIAKAARQISASLIAASGDVPAPEDVCSELETRRLPRITADDLRKISGPPPAFLSGPIAIPDSVPEPIDNDDEPTLLPSGSGPRVDRMERIARIDHSERADRIDREPAEEEATEPRDLPIRTRPTSTSPAFATGPIAGEFFIPLPPRNRAAVLRRFRHRIAPAGTIVLQCGETGHGLIVVVNGLLELHTDRDGAGIVLGAIAPGEYIGEASLLTRTAVEFDVIAAVDSEIMVLGESEVYEITGAYPALWTELKHTADRRAREHEHRLGLTNRALP